MPNYISEFNLPVLNTATGQVESQLFTVKDPNASGGGGNSNTGEKVYRFPSYKSGNWNNAVLNETLLLSEANEFVVINNYYVTNQILDLSRGFLSPYCGEFNQLFWPNFNGKVITKDANNGYYYKRPIFFNSLNYYNQPYNYDYMANGSNSYDAGYSNYRWLNTCPNYNQPIDVTINHVDYNEISTASEVTPLLARGIVVQSCNSYNSLFSLNYRASGIKHANNNVRLQSNYGSILYNCRSFNSPMLFNVDLIFNNYSATGLSLILLNNVIASCTSFYSDVMLNYNIKLFNSLYYPLAVTTGGTTSPAVSATVRNLYLNINASYLNENKKTVYSDTFTTTNLIAPGLNYNGKMANVFINMHLNDMADQLYFTNIFPLGGSSSYQPVNPSIMINCVRNSNENSTLYEMFNVYMPFGSNQYKLNNGRISLDISIDSTGSQNVYHTYNFENLFNLCDYFTNNVDFHFGISSIIKQSNTRYDINRCVLVNDSQYARNVGGNIYINLKKADGVAGVSVIIINLFGYAGRNINGGGFAGRKKSLFITKDVEESTSSLYQYNGDTVYFNNHLLGCYSFAPIATPLPDGNGYFNEQWNFYLYNNL